MKRKKKSKNKVIKQWGSLPSITGVEIGRDFAAKMCFLPAYPMKLVLYAIEHSIPLCERNHFISAYEDERLEFLRLMKDFCADKLHIHTPRDRADLYKEWEALLLLYSNWLKEALGNKSVNINDANLVKVVEQLHTSLALINKTALYGRISRREMEKRINKLFAKIDVSILPIEFQNFIREADDNQLKTVELETIEGKGNIPLEWLKHFKRQLESMPRPDLASATDSGAGGDEKRIEPINLNKPSRWWNCKNLQRLRVIDSNPKRDGILGTASILKHLKKYLRKHERSDIAKTLRLKHNRIVTSMQYRTMFLQK